MRALVIMESDSEARAWTVIARTMGLDVAVLATRGPVRAFPRALRPLGVDLSPGGDPEALRSPVGDVARRVAVAVAETDAGTAIVVATGDGVEGHVAALDVAEILIGLGDGVADRVVRVLPGEMTARGVRASLAAARPLMSCLPEMVDMALPGRARAVVDRAMGAAMSGIAGAPSGRVRTALLGALWMANRASERLRGNPETGEIVFQSRASLGGRPFVARVALTGRDEPGRVMALAALAQRWKGRFVPGCVRPLSPAGAAIAPRMGTVRPFTSDEAVVHAARHHAMPVGVAMRGLRDAWLSGAVSAPVTSSRGLSRRIAGDVVRLGFACGMEGLEVDVLSSDGRLSDLAGVTSGLYPLSDLTVAGTDALAALVRRPVTVPTGGWDRDTAREAMTALVARRAFEAGREILMEPGIWSPDNTGAVATSDAKLLRDLDWLREDGFRFPWSRDLLTGTKVWPLDAVLLEIAAIEDLGNASGRAARAAAMAVSGEVVSMPFPLLPRPSAAGMAVLRALPSASWIPETCRAIEAALDSGDDGEVHDGVTDRVRRRVVAGMERAPAGLARSAACL